MRPRCGWTVAPSPAVDRPLETLRDAVARVTAEVADVVFARQTTGFRRWEKAPGDPVSEIDLMADAVLRERLTPLVPDAGWLSEETADEPARLERERVWVVDPIDGTRDYLRGRSGWCVSVALVEDGRPVLGVLAAPPRGELWLAVADEGTWRNGERLRVADRTELAGAHIPADALPKGSELVKTPKPNSIALRLGLVAAGEADLLVTRRWGHEWDVAAAALLVEEAGGVVTDAAGAPLRFNRPRPRAFGLVASGPGLHAAAVERYGGGPTAG